MKFSIEIKDEQIIAVAKHLGFSYPADEVPEMAEHVAAIQTKLEEFITPAIKAAVFDAPDVKAKRAELDSLIEAKLSAAKGAEIKG